MTLRSICVFCGASPGATPIYQEAAEALGRHLAENGIQLVYGGGAVGLMGMVANAALAVEALTHRGTLDRRADLKAAYPHGNERLEFLGDRVLSLAMADLLLRRFPGESEGQLARRHAALVSARTLVEIAEAIGLAAHRIAWRGAPAPTATTSPAPSDIGMRPSAGFSIPDTTAKSWKFSELARTRTRSWPGPASGWGRSSITILSSPPGAFTAATFIGVSSSEIEWGGTSAAPPSIAV